jgi:Rod binding domain-containing protein
MNDGATFIQAQTAVAQAKAAPRIGNVTNMDQARKVAEDFESYFLGQILQPLFANFAAEEPFGGGPSEEIWRSMQVDEYGKALARSGGIGIADHVFEQILRLQEVEAT